MKVVDAHDVKQKVLSYAFFERGHLAAVTEGLNNADVLSIDKGKSAVEFEIKVSRSDLQKELFAINYAKGFVEAADDAARKQLQLDIGVPTKAGGWSKVSKHEEYIDPKKYFERSNYKRYFHEQYLPNYFYLVVPEKLVPLALEGTSDTRYGVIAYDGCRQKDQHYGYFSNFSNGTWYKRGDTLPEDARWISGRACDSTCYRELAVRKTARKLHDSPVSRRVLDEILKRAVTENIRLLAEVLRLHVRIEKLLEETT